MSANRVLVYGGKGALGATVVDHFKANNWWVLNVDLAANQSADANVTVTEVTDWLKQSEQVCAGVADCLGTNKLNAILCVAGGFAMSDAKSEDLLKTCDLMVKQSVWSSVISARLATKHLVEGGLLQLTGAAPATGPTPVMVGYGMAKAAVHQLVSSLADKASGLPNATTVVAIVPVTLDTAGNRAGMPKADFTSWTTLPYIAGLLFDWAGQAAKRPANGSLVKLTTKNGETTLTNL